MWLAVAALVMMVVSIALAPRPKMPSNTSSTADQENPTAEAGKTQAVLFGRATFKDPNILYYGEQGVTEKKVSA